MKMYELPKCRCGKTVGLFTHAEQWWCPACIVKKIEGLEEAMAAISQWCFTERDYTNLDVSRKPEAPPNRETREGDAVAK